MSAENDFQDLAKSIDTPMFVVTTVGPDGERSGCLVGFATQCSIEPPRFLVALSVKNHTFRVAADATHLGVHLIERSQTDLAEIFGGETTDKVDKFQQCDWHEGPHGVPIVDALPGWFVGRILQRIDLGDHVGHVLAPVAARPADVEELQLGDAEYIDAGHAP